MLAVRESAGREAVPNHTIGALPTSGAISATDRRSGAAVHPRRIRSGHRPQASWRAPHVDEAEARVRTLRAFLDAEA
jgi:hypothetical protein